MRTSGRPARMSDRWAAEAWTVQKESIGLQLIPAAFESFAISRALFVIHGTATAACS